MKQIIRFFKKPFRWAKIYGTALALFFAFALLDAFVIPRAQMQVVAAEPPTVSSAPSVSLTASASSAQSATPAESTASSTVESEISSATEPVVTATSYSDANIKINIETLRENDTTFYVADIQVSDPILLKTALANDTFGRNIKASTSDIADQVNAIFAINGDYYGSRDAGWVLRNGVWYRQTSRVGEALVIDSNGNFSIVDEDTVSASSIRDAWQIFSFGPALINNGEIAVGVNEEINGKASNSNPRTAIGQVGEGHYIVIVSDGRTDSSAGFSLYQLAQQFQERACTVAYNLDGGGSSTMIFNGEVVNMPVGGRGSSGTERKVSDIVYFGY